MPETELIPGATAGTVTVGYTLGPALSRGTRYVFGVAANRRAHHPGLRELEFEASTIASGLLNPPSDTLAGVVSQLAHGERLDFPTELRELARAALARRGANTESTEEWAARLASEAAGIFD